MRRHLGAVALAALLVFAPGLAAAPTRAHETTDGRVLASHCVFAHGGSATVTAGSEVVIAQSWLTQLRGDQTTFLGAQTSILSVNDGLMVDVSDQWGAPTGTNGGFASSVEVPTGIVLASGEQMRFTFALLLERELVADMGYGAGPNRYAGLVFGGTCTVTAE